MFLTHVSIYLLFFMVILVALSVVTSSGKLMFMYMKPSNTYSYGIITFVIMFITKEIYELLLSHCLKSSAAVFFKYKDADERGFVR